MTENNSFNKFADLMDRNIIGVQYGVYAVAGLGLCIAIRSIKPFTRFCKPSDIPRLFIAKRMKFNGKVVNVTGGNNPVININHQPLISLPLLTSQCDDLPVQISSIDITPNGGIWLGTILQGSKIGFLPLRIDNQAAHCIVTRQNQDIARHLVSIGFASVSGWDIKLDKDPLYSKYYKSLLGAQKTAEWKGAGIWQERNPSILSNVLNRIRSIRYAVA